MAGRGPAIHDLADRAKDVDGRHKDGHDEMRQPAVSASSIRPVLNRTEVGLARPSVQARAAIDGRVRPGRDEYTDPGHAP